MAQAKSDEESSTGEHGSRRHHILVAVYGIQGHLNPARTFAYRLAQTGGCAVTLSVPLSGHRLMFPSGPHEEVDDGVITYIPFSDGADDGIWPKNIEERTQRHQASSKSLSSIVTRLAATGRPVACMVCTLNMPAVLDVAREHGIPLAVYWIQPATALLAYRHYFHGHEQVIAGHAAEPAYEVRFPAGMYPLRIRDMPSFLTQTTHSEFSEMIMQGFRDLFMLIEKEKPVVLVNTFAALEEVAIKALEPFVDVVAVGPAVPPPVGQLGALPWPEGSDAQIHLVKSDDDQENSYLDWLDAQPESSVVYLSFGSLLTYTMRQVEEILRGLELSGRRYLWVVRRDGRAEGVDSCLANSSTATTPRGGRSRPGVVVEWCDQLRVLSHPSVGCFVTHCGWNSTLEAAVCGVPVVAAPSWSDQPVNALLVEEWGVGVRAERDADGVLTGLELVRCVELVMGDGEKAKEVKASVERLKERADEAGAKDGAMEGSLRNFVGRIQALGMV